MRRGRSFFGRMSGNRMGVAIGLLLAALAGCSDKSGSGSRTKAGNQQPTIGHEAWLSDPEFTPDATPEQLRQATADLVDNLVKRYPNKPDALNAAGRALMGLGHLEKAKGLWQTCLTLDPQFVGTYFGLGMVADEAGDFGTAARMYRKVIELAPEESRGPDMLARTLVNDGKVEEAVTMLATYFKTHAPTVDGLEQLGSAYLQLKQYDKAKTVFEMVVQAVPDERRGYYGLVRVYTQLGDRQKAREYSKKFRARVAANQKKGIDSVRLFSDTAFLRDMLLRTLNEAGEAAAKIGDPDFAEEMWRKAAVLVPKDGLSRHKLLSLYDQQKRDADGLVVCQELSEIEPDNGDYWLNIGLLQGRLQHLDRARAALQQAIRLDPHNPRYQAAYKVLKESE